LIVENNKNDGCQIKYLSVWEEKGFWVFGGRAV